MGRYLATMTTRQCGQEIGGGYTFIPDGVSLEEFRYAWALGWFENFNKSDTELYFYGLWIFDLDSQSRIIDDEYNWDSYDSGQIYEALEMFLRNFPKWSECAFPGFDALADEEHDTDAAISPDDFARKFDDMALLEQRRQMQKACDDAWRWEVEEWRRRGGRDRDLTEVRFRLEFAKQWLKNKGGE